MTPKALGEKTGAYPVKFEVVRNDLESQEYTVEVVGYFDSREEAEALAAKLNARASTIATLTAEAAELRAERDTLKDAITATAAVLEKLMESIKSLADVAQETRKSSVIRNTTDAASFLNGLSSNLLLTNHFAAKELVKIDAALSRAMGHATELS